MTVLLLLLSVGIAHSQTGAGKPVLSKVADIRMPGPAVRFDYQSLDVEHGRLYISHMNADQLVVFDIRKRKVVANLNGFSRVHGVIAVPEIGRVYASATGNHEVAVVDMATLKTIATAGPIPAFHPISMLTEEVMRNSTHHDDENLEDANHA